jgi:acyl-coenzyme A thioesterase PaaI-like protein
MTSLFRRYPRLIRFWPPLLGAGIRVTGEDKARRSIDVEMRLTRFNRNPRGVHFGGSLFAMADPFYMILLAEGLGPGYVVWDKAGSIRFRRPGMGTVRAHFELGDARLAEIREAVDRDGVHDAIFMVNIVDGEGSVVAKVERTLYCATQDAHAARAETRVTRSLKRVTENTEEKEGTQRGQLLRPGVLQRPQR